MRILQLNFEKHWRGGERQVLYAIEGLKNAGVKAELLCREGSPLYFKAKKSGMTIQSCKGVFDVILFLLKHGKEYDVLHCQTSNMLTYCVATKWMHKRPIMLSRRVSYVPKGRLTLLKYRAANKIISISETVRNILTNKGVTNVRVISDIALPVALDKHRALNYLAQFNCQGKKIIATLAAFEIEKDPVTMVEAIRNLYLERMDFVFFHFGEGSMLSGVKDKIREYNLQDVYHTPGFIENVQDYFSVMDVFAFSSLEEGLGSSILDAFLYKVPVASTNGGGLKDLVTTDRGLVCNTGDHVQLAKNISVLLDDEMVRNRLVKNAFDYVMQNHNMEVITSEYLEEYHKLIHQGHRVL